MVCCTYFNNQKDLVVDVLDFQFELGYFGYSLGYITKYWANFCSIFWSLCLQLIETIHRDHCIHIPTAWVGLKSSLTLLHNGLTLVSYY